MDVVLHTYFSVLPEFAWLAEKTARLARASCSTKEHIRAIDGSVLVEKASNLHAGPCQAEMAEIEVAQNALCFAAPPGLAKFRQRIDAHTRLSRQIPKKPEFGRTVKMEWLESGNRWQFGKPTGGLLANFCGLAKRIANVFYLKISDFITFNGLSVRWHLPCKGKPSMCIEKEH